MNVFLRKIAPSSIKCLNWLLSSNMTLISVFVLLLGTAALPPENGADAPNRNQINAVSVSDVLQDTEETNGDASKMCESSPKPDVNAVMYSGAVRALRSALKTCLQRRDPLRKMQSAADAALIVAAGFGTVQRLRPVKDHTEEHHFIWLSRQNIAVPVRAGPVTA